MQISTKDLRAAAIGAVSVTEENGGVVFHRFSATEEEMYKLLDVKQNRTDYKKAHAPAGIKLKFKTDSKSLSINATASAASRKYFSFDVFENGIYLVSLSNFNEPDLKFNYTATDISIGEFSAYTPLSEGEKEITLYLPWSVAISNFKLTLDDGASFIPSEKPKKKLLVYGDSITQGYDALYPHRRYATRLAEALGAEEINKGIGGEVFRPELASHKADFSPDYVTVAYGTNDWSRSKKEDFLKNAKEFYTILSKNYPNSKIFAITPIWRIEATKNSALGAFSFVDEYISEIAATLPNVTVIHGIDLVPHYIDLYADLSLHPRDAGFDFYFANLYNEIKKYV